MSPFGLLMRYYRNERGVALRRLAEKIPLSEKVLSAIETGRRRPLAGEELEALCRHLDLSPRETAALEAAARDSDPRLRIPDDATPREYRLAHRLVRALGHLSGDQIAAIYAVLGDTPQPQVGGQYDAELRQI